MPRIAANDVEKALLMAAVEIVASNVAREEAGKRRDEMIEAFKTASRLRNINYHIVPLKGRKTKAVQMVIRTTIKRDAVNGNGKYVLCLIPYTKSQIEGARRPFKFQTEIWGEGDIHTRKLIG